MTLDQAGLRAVILALADRFYEEFTRGSPAPAA
jgi:hypothetical protein